MQTVKKLTKIGNSYGVILPKEVLKAAGIDEKTPLDIAVNGDELTIKPANLKDYKVMKTFLTVLKDFDPLLKRLAKVK